MNLTTALGLSPGEVVAIVGCGGKTALLHRLAAENRGGTVLLSTTTHILHPGQLVDRELSGGERPGPGVNLIHGGAAGSKLNPPPMDKLAASRPPGGLTLLECDGSRGLPLKGWAAYEPVVPEFATRTVGVCALWPVGEPACPEGIHRPELFRALTGISMGERVTLGHLAAMISHPRGMFREARGRRALVLNTREENLEPEAAAQLLVLLPEDFRAGLDVAVMANLHQGDCVCLKGDG